MKSFETRTTIQAPAATIWALLTDAAGYPAWNTTVDKIEGTIALGGKITVHATISDRAFPVTVTVLDEAEKMVWSSGLPLGLFKGERTFLLTAQDGGAVEFFMHEAFTGLLASVFGRGIPDLQPVFDDFAADLKKAAEAAEASAR